MSITAKDAEFIKKYGKFIWSLKMTFNDLWLPLTPLVLAFLIKGYFGFKSNYSVISKSIIDLISTPGGSLILTSVLIAIALILFFLKKRQQFWYGVIEASFAVINSYSVAESISETIRISNQSLIVITSLSTIYLVVRGFSNIDEGRKKPYLFKPKPKLKSPAL